MLHLLVDSALRQKVLQEVYKNCTKILLVCRNSLSLHKFFIFVQWNQYQV